ncbi:MAG: hypothetical protein JWN95_1508 [Frankiales bacterium]|nr:hypothetical protein [Frankiales bacterium]
MCIEARELKRGIRKGLPALVGLVVLAAGAWLIYRDRSGLAAAYDDVGAGSLLISALLAVLGTACIERIWASVLRGLGTRAPARQVAGVFFVSQLGKYLPGSVWPVLAQIQFGRRVGAPRRNMLAANLIMLVVVSVSGLLSSAVLLPWAARAGLHGLGWVFVLLVPLVALLHPRAVPALLDAAFGLLHREPLRLRVDGRRMWAAMGWGFLTWVLLGAHLLVMTRALGATGADAIGAAIGGMGLAFAAGLLFIPAPAGAGLREAVLVATFGPEIGTTNALAVAVASRVLLLVADVTLALAGALVGRTGPALSAGDTPRSSGVGNETEVVDTRGSVRDED